MGFDMAAGNHRTAGKKRLGLKNIIHRRNGGNPLVEDLPAFIDQTRSVGGLYSRAGFARIHADCHLADGFSLAQKDGKGSADIKTKLIAKKFFGVTPYPCGSEKSTVRH